ncbi:Mms22p [Lachancea thermotolerans CBS 6340]|uniref:KLTH0E08514p n=1 Tax=Lachancea thermotolerans (strain ATCC 56472 / CBS 6340 / NRRL Y-8284) TaxID=559295 RepID=C5DHZ8_LACTC|nr:KLTH0E08514p [Lachancea thermotolerans CBS 6340]CAR23409.1 KLTH0E08514p [Lachancea thermotolerans CBS 6340]
MDEDTNLTYIADSEAEPDEYLLWKPARPINYGEDGQIDQHNNDSGPMPEPLAFQQTEGSDARYQSPIQRVRSLRKRTAIQKKPYSLDRIKHRHLLRGFGISNEDELPSSLQDHRDLQYNDEASQGGYFMNDDKSETECQNVESFEVISSEHQRFNSNSNGVVTSEAQSRLKEERIPENSAVKTATPANHSIIYRGRQVNVNSGFRGILPKVAWTKALNDSRQSKRQLPKQERRSGKGVAKRKKQKVNQRQDDSLFGDLFIADDNFSAEDNLPHNIVDLSDSPEEKPELISKYLDSRYSEAYAFDDLSEPDVEGPDNFGGLDGPSTISADSKRSKRSKRPRQPSTSKLDKSGDILQRESTYSVSSGDSSSAEEWDDHTIDTMLRARTRKTGGSTKAAKSQRVKRPYEIVANRRITYRRSGTMTANPQHNESHYSIENGKPGAFPKYRRPPHQKLIEFPGKAKISRRPEELDWYREQHAISSTYPSWQKNSASKSTLSSGNQNLNSLVSRAGKLFFETAIEQESDRFTLVPSSKKKSSTINLEAAHSPKNPDNKPNSDVQVFDAIIFDSLIHPPDTIHFTLSEKAFKISRFDTNFENSLSEVFNHLIEVGAIDTEVTIMNSSLVAVLYHLNKPGLWELVNEFHNKFRSKVNLLRSRAKAIHFYQISVCQVMLLEIAGYSSVSRLLASEVTKKIIDHTVSFFRLLSKCYNLVANSNLMEQCYILLAKVVEKTLLKSELWDKLRNTLFPPKVALILVKYFPTRETFWEIVELGHTFESVVDWFKFVHFSVGACGWEISHRLILVIYNFFKTRKFQDFEEEEDRWSEYPIFSQNELKQSRRTAFNSFLGLLASVRLPMKIIERITPLGQIISLQSPGLLANRINLLLVLADQAPTSFEIKLEDLCYPYLHENSADPVSPVMLDLILKGFISILQINSKKNLPLRARFISLIWQSVLKRHEARIEKAWLNFLRSLCSIFYKLKKSESVILKALHPILMSTLPNKKNQRDGVGLIKLFEDNLQKLEPAWVARNLHQILASSAGDSERIFSFYFNITEYLASRKVITWWSVLKYNNFNHSDDYKLLFYTRAIEKCDDSTFLQIRHVLFQTVTDLLLQRSDVPFIKFIRSISKRDRLFKINPELPFTASHLEIITKVLTGFKRSNDRIVLKVVICKLKELLLGHPEKKPLISEVTKFLNKEYVDLVKNDPDFLFLKNQFNISDEETQKSIFREALSMRKDDIERSLHIEREILRIGSRGQNLEHFLGMLESSMGTGLYVNDFLFLSQLLEANAFSEGLERTSTQWFVLSNLILMINNILKQNFCQVSSEDFFGLYHLHYWICRAFSLKEFELDAISDKSVFLREACVLQTRTLLMSSGFLEHNSLLSLSEEFLTKPRPTRFEPKAALTGPVHSLLKEYGPFIMSLAPSREDIQAFQGDVATQLSKLSFLVKSKVSRG